MATTTHLSLTLLSLTTILLLLSPSTLSQSPSAPAPAPSGPVNLTAILEKGGQYTTFIRLLNTTQVGNQIENELNNSNDGRTVFAPTDNAFNNLPSGALNNLKTQQQVQLVLYHVTPKYYTLQNLLLVSNPVRTQATGQDGGVFGLNFTGQGNQVNVSTGIVETRINNALRQAFPLAVYQVDEVLLPEELFGNGTSTPAPAGSPPGKSSGGGATSNTTSNEAEPPSSGSGTMGLGLGLWFGLVCIGAFAFI